MTRSHPARLLFCAAIAGPAAAAAAAPPAYYFQAIGPAQTSAVAINDAGQVVLESSEYPATGGLDERLYLYSPQTDAAPEVGLTDAAHTGPNGLEGNDGAVLNAHGQVAGTAGRWDGAAFRGYDAWVYSPGGTSQVIGLTDDNHTTGNGSVYDQALATNAAGLVVGVAERMDGIGQTFDAWVYSPGTGRSQLIGLTDAAHTQAGGSPNNYACGLNDAGQVIGSADRYRGTVFAGSDAWVYSAATGAIRTVGLVDDDHPGGNTPVAINARGQVAGVAARGEGGTDAWVDLGTGAKVIGLTDAAHQSSDGERDVEPLLMSAAGGVAGTSARFRADDAQVGQDAWAYSPATDRTELIGLTGGAYTSPNGRADDEPVAINAAGEVAGTSERFEGTGGSDGWLFDPARDATFGFALPAADPQATFGQIVGLDDAGDVVGTFYPDGTSGPSDAFRWSESGGFQPLDGLTDAGRFPSPSAASVVNAAGQIAGFGTAGGSATPAPFLLTPVPEPTAAAGLAVAAAAGFARRRVRGGAAGRRSGAATG